MKNFKINTAPAFQDVKHADGSKTYDTCYGPITINRPDVVKFVDMICEGKIHFPKVMLDMIYQKGWISKEELSKIIRIID